jgi:hypothetical protein
VLARQLGQLAKNFAGGIVPWTWSIAIRAASIGFRCDVFAIQFSEGAGSRERRACAALQIVFCPRDSQQRNEPSPTLLTTLPPHLGCGGSGVSKTD